MSWSIGMDLGGTVLKAVAAQEDGVILSAKSLPINDRRGSIAQWVDGGCKLISDFERELDGEAPAIGVSAPGLASPDRRRIDHLPGKLFGIEGLDWTEALGRDKRVPVLNDAHAALLGECWVGVARQKRDVVMLTLGTGVGGAIMMDGRLLNGVSGRAGHLGHMSLDPDGPPSNTGMPGAIEVLIGDFTVGDRTSGRFNSTRDLVAAYRSGDAEATADWLRSVRALGCAIASYINIIDPELVVLAGGITKAGKALMDPLKEIMDEVEWRPGGHRVPVVLASLGQKAGALGAAYAANHIDSI